ERMKYIALIVASMVLVGCESTQEYLGKYQAEAEAASKRKAEFEFDCKDVSTTLISEKRIETFRLERPQYQIGAKGCGKKKVYLVNCNEDEGCTVLDSTVNIQTQ
ncbi:hypothetical protein, partial [Vibrio mediterranei]|uniref:hypothetical protein n=1 Tax=Vibrio mediterranei TaxID=689 RepID=UPI00148C5E41